MITLIIIISIFVILGVIFQQQQRVKGLSSALVAEEAYLTKMIHFLGHCDELENNGYIQQCVYCAAGLELKMWPEKEIIQHTENRMIKCECPACDPDWWLIQSHYDHMMALYSGYIKYK